ncbi:TPR repeat-containing serine/threonine protein kinase [Calothrix sp. NIES-4071]|nr:TPR repeat-containing serine/threonine protein kinase [Calothrix sp. NIES-4071]BAZ56549.1 TPR repeat-containing serine/threonine protein kinase [Calothrix sp. NIES-4105]
MLQTKLRGRYKIIRDLGKGGFSETYLANDMDLPGNPHCVVKLLKPIFTDPESLEIAARLFEREAQVLYKVGTHDQIPRLLAHFEENQQFYLVQEYIPGTLLSKELTKGQKWSDEQAINFLKDLLQILEFVHAEQVIHRDVKPANLIRRASDNKITLIDFGAVKKITAVMETSQGITVIGTPGYTPVEQRDGNPKFSSDIYAVGMTCIQGLTGINPDTLQKKPEVAWNKQDVNPQLAAIIDKMVCRDYRRRYQSVPEVLQALSKLEQPTLIETLWKTKKKVASVSVIGILIIAVATIPLTHQIIPDFISISQLFPINFSVYENSDYAIKIKYPQNWVKNEVEDKTTGELARFSPYDRNNSDVGAEIILEIQPLKRPLVLSEYTNLKVNEIIQFFPEAKIHESHTVKLPNIPTLVHEVVYSGKDNKLGIKRKAVWTVKDKTAYIITYSAQESEYDKYLNTATKMINSLELL